jgi:hypothetical protein
VSLSHREWELVSALAERVEAQAGELAELRQLVETLVRVADQYRAEVAAEVRRMSEVAALTRRLRQLEGDDAPL